MNNDNELQLSTTTECYAVMLLRNNNYMSIFVQIKYKYLQKIYIYNIKTKFSLFILSKNILYSEVFRKNKTLIILTHYCYLI